MNGGIEAHGLCEYSKGVMREGPRVNCPTSTRIPNAMRGAGACCAVCNKRPALGGAKHAFPSNLEVPVLVHCTSSCSCCSCSCRASLLFFLETVSTDSFLDRPSESVRSNTSNCLPLCSSTPYHSLYVLRYFCG